MTLGSLFDGIGGFPLAAARHGIQALWASEIEPFPIAVTKERFPDMKHLGDITKINGADIEPVDIITGGSPCQDLSVAGKRAGMAGARSGLFMEQVRIIKEARARHGSPRYMVWENVPGAFSSAGGEDFRAVLEETARVAEDGVSIPRPAEGAWATAGAILADTWSIAWRILDAQFWGVPQRRRRIFLVADFGGQSAPEILFKPESVSGDIAEGRDEREGAAEGIEGGIRSARLFGTSGFSNFTSDGVASTQRSCVSKQSDVDLVVYENHAQDSRIEGPLDVSPTCSKKWGTGGNNVPLTLQMREGKEGGGKGPLVAEDMSATLGTGSTQIAFTPSSFGGYEQGWGSLRANGGDLGGGSETLITQCYGGNDIAQTLDASYYKGVGSRNGKEREFIASPLAVRRLTPLECERLQGFPDYWTDIKGASDSARYKALGNSVAIPCVEFVMRRIKEAAHE